MTMKQVAACSSVCPRTRAESLRSKEQYLLLQLRGRGAELVEKGVKARCAQCRSDLWPRAVPIFGHQPPGRVSMKGTATMNRANATRNMSWAAEANRP